MTKHFKSSNGRRFAVACGAVMLTAFLWSGAAMALTVDASALESEIQDRSPGMAWEIQPNGWAQGMAWEIQPNGWAQGMAWEIQPNGQKRDSDGHLDVQTGQVAVRSPAQLR